MDNLQEQALPMNRPSRCTSLYVERGQFERMFAAMAKSFAVKLERDLNALKDELAGVLDKRFVLFKNKALWFDRDVAGIYPRWDKVDLPILPYYMDADTANAHRIWRHEGLTFSCMTLEEARKTFHKESGNPYVENNKCLTNVANIDCKKYAVVVDLPFGAGYAKWYHIDNESFYTNGHYFSISDVAIFVPIHRLDGATWSLLMRAANFRHIFPPML